MSGLDDTIGRKRKSSSSFHQPQSFTSNDLSPEMRWAFSVKSCASILDIAKALNLGKVATHTALVFFHRFFKHQSFLQHDRLLMGAACVYLAAKVEERSNVKLSHIAVQYLKFMDVLLEEVDPADYNKNQIAREQVPVWKNRIITCERALLYTIGFDLNVTHPFKALQDLMKTVRDVMAQHTERQNNFDHRTFFSQACKFLNDSFSQPHLIDAEPSYSAAMALYMTTCLYEISPPAGKSWIEIFQIQNETRFLNDCLEAIDMYSEKRFRRLNISKVPEPSLLSVTSSFSGGGGLSSGGIMRRPSPYGY